MPPIEDHKTLISRQWTQDDVWSTKAVAAACVVTGVPTLVAVRTKNLNYTTMALITSAASVAAYYFLARKNAKRRMHQDIVQKVLEDNTRDGLYCSKVVVKRDMLKLEFKAIHCS